MVQRTRLNGTSDHSRNVDPHKQIKEPEREDISCSVFNRPGLVEYVLQSEVSYVWIGMRFLCLAIFIQLLLRGHIYLAFPFILVAGSIRSRLQEGVLAVKGLGVQLQRYGRFRILSDDDIFIPIHKIGGVFLNEVFEGFTVQPTLQIVVRGADKFQLVLHIFHPQLDTLQTIWRGLRETLRLSINDSLG